MTAPSWSLPSNGELKLRLNIPDWGAGKENREKERERESERDRARERASERADSDES